MNIYTTIAFIAVLIAVCYLANLYAHYNAIRGDTTTLKTLYNVLIDIRGKLSNIDDKIKDEQSTAPTED